MSAISEYAEKHGVSHTTAYRRLRATGERRENCQP